MAQPAQTIGEIFGRSATLTADGASDTAVRVWKLVRGINGTATVPAPTTVGLPAIGSKHPTLTDLILTKYTVSEDGVSGAVEYTAEYSRPSEKEGTAGEGDDQEEYRIESRGWRGTSYTSPACYDAETGQAIMLPTGEPFENVPDGHRGGLTFYITFQTTKKSSAINANCTVNSAAIVIDEVTVGARCGRLSASQEEIVNAESKYKYRVTLEVEIVSNRVKLNPGEEEIDIGHDVALLLQGYKYKGTYTDHQGDVHEVLMPFVELDGQGGQVPSQTPGFLTADGEKVVDPSPTNCHYLRVHTIKGAAWDAAWFH